MSAHSLLCTNLALVALWLTLNRLNLLDMCSKTDAMLAALRRENNQYLAAIANVSAAVQELAGTVESLQRQLGGCNVAATQALRAASGGDVAAELSMIVWLLAGIGLLLLVKSPVMSLMLLAWGCLNGRGVFSVILMFPVDPLGALAFAGFQIREAIDVMVEERMLSRRAARSGSRIPRPISTCRVDMRTPAGQVGGEGDDAEAIFHDVLPDPADAGVPLPAAPSGRRAGHVARVRPWYVRAVVGAMDGVVGDAP